MKILKTVEKFPGGLMVGPLLIASVIHTWAPGIVEIGGATTALFSSAGTMCLAGLLLFIIGSQLPIRQIGAVLKRHGTLLVIKLLAAFAVGMILMRYFGAKGILGISTMAFVCVLSSNNPGVFLALTKTYGDEIDHAAFGLWNVACMPTIPLLILGQRLGGVFYAFYGIIVVLATYTTATGMAWVASSNIQREDSKWYKLVVAVVCIGAFVLSNFGTFGVLMNIVMKAVSYLGIVFSVCVIVSKIYRYVKESNGSVKA